MRGRYVSIEVADKGTGFNERYPDRLFIIFQRLRGRMQFTGTGMRLTLCKKVVNRHRGSIMARSQEGTGSTFIVYLPTK